VKHTLAEEGRGVTSPAFLLSRRSKVTLQGQITIAMLGGNSMVGRALGRLLPGYSYEVRLPDEPAAFRSQELLDGVDGLILMPDLGKECPKPFLIAIRRTPKMARIPNLALP
jgi:hypothetical protein